MGVRPGSVLIFGAGPAGLAAAIASSRLGADVIVVEKTETVGRKLSMTGNGRANLTNRNLTPEDYNPAARERMREHLSVCGVGELTSFLASVGVFTRAEGDGIYPTSGQAVCVTEALEDAALRAGVKIRTGAQLKRIRPADNGGFYCRAGDADLSAAKVILATGGLSGPRTCHASGDAYYLCEQLGMKLTPRHPALVPLLTEDETLPADSGVRALARVQFAAGDRVIARESGEIQFSPGTFSGIPVLQASGRVAEAMAQGEDVTARVDLLPDFEGADWTRAMGLFSAQAEKRPVLSCLKGMINGALAESIGKRLGIGGDDRIGSITKAQREALEEQIRAFPVRIRGIGDYTRAQATAGGIDLAETDRYGRVKRLPGLYLAGELLDVDGRCGGYNLHWAFTSGLLAGIHAATGGDFNTFGERVLAW
ncbi:MAG: aminoacetone oxidase family FAD-binding enzyme [Lachnospiraceae bacterium]|nr:aminoacetone oxidase family FAD-binding enzyme [Lachnospiraceae bacterium]